MVKVFGTIAESWQTFTVLEKRNIAIYILGIMLYKFGLEAFNGSIVALATNRYDYDAILNNHDAITFERVGLLQGLNQAFQCVGAILIAPLIKRYPTKNVLATAVLVFGILSAILLIVDAATGGTFVPAGWNDDPAREDDFSYYGSYNTDGMIPIYCVAGIAYGMVELIRRVIPRDIVGGNVQKLRRMDAMVHIFYEISGTAGAFTTGLVLIPRFGNNFSFIITPILFSLAAVVWFFVSEVRSMDVAHDEDEEEEEEEERPRHRQNYLYAVGWGFWLFFESVWVGAKLIFSNRKFVWLLPGYAVALYGHRYLENGVAPPVARRYLGNSAWSQIMVGGSNLGELFGALFVFLFTNLVQTPIPWLRLDALLLLIVWYIPYWYPPRGDVRYAWIVAATFIPISFGWAAGDVSLAAYIQASLARVESKTKNVSALGAVMAFLYCAYIITYAITNPLLGQYLDRVYSSQGGTDNPNARVNGGLVYTAGVQLTIVGALVFFSTFIPQGSFALNPKQLFEEDLAKDVALDTSAEASDEEVKRVHSEEYPEEKKI